MTTYRHKNLKSNKIRDLASNANVAAQAAEKVYKLLDAVGNIVAQNIYDKRRLSSSELKKNGGNH